MNSAQQQGFLRKFYKKHTSFMLWLLLMAQKKKLGYDWHHIVWMQNSHQPVS